MGQPPLSADGPLGNRCILSGRGPGITALLTLSVVNKLEPHVVSVPGLGLPGGLLSSKAGRPGCVRLEGKDRCHTQNRSPVS